MISKLEINTKIKPKPILTKLLKSFFRLVLIILDSRIPGYMNLYTSYLKFLGISVSGCPLYICADLKLDGTNHQSINFGNNIVISSGVQILTHDYSVNKGLISLGIENDYEIFRLSQVTIDDNAFIGMNALLLPGVNVGKNSIVGAGSVVTRSVPDNVVVSGNPAREVCSLEVYAGKVRTRIETDSSSYYRN